MKMMQTGRQSYQSRNWTRDHWRLRLLERAHEHPQTSPLPAPCSLLSLRLWLVRHEPWAYLQLQPSVLQKKH